MSVSTGLLNSIATQHPDMAAFIAERDTYRDELHLHAPHFSNFGDVPPGHSCSPIPTIADIQKDEGPLC
jgi:hypothetical protein